MQMVKQEAGENESAVLQVCYRSQEKAERQARVLSELKPLFNLFSAAIALGKFPFTAVNSTAKLVKQNFPETTRKIEKGTELAFKTILGIIALLVANGYMYLSLKEGGVDLGKIETMLGLVVPGVLVFAVDSYVFYTFLIKDLGGEVDE